MGEKLRRCEWSTAREEDEVQLIFSKKRKLYCEIENSNCDDVNLPDDSVSLIYGCREHDESSDVVEKNLRSTDRENVDSQCEGFETEISTSSSGICRPVTPISELCGDSDQSSMISSTPKRKSPPVSSRRIFASSAAEKMPPAAEIEEFFAAAEKCEQKRFAEKYNYDIVKDIPLEGKYQWVRLQP